MRSLLLTIATLTALHTAPAAAKDEIALYGHAREEVLRTPNLRTDTKQPASFFVHVLPWREAPNTTLDAQLQRLVGNPPPREAFDPANAKTTKLLPVAKDFAVSLPIKLISDPPGNRAAVLFTCHYKGKKTHYREMAFVGDMIAFLAVGKKPVMKHIDTRAKKLCKESPTKAKRAALRKLVTMPPGEGDGADRLEHVIFALKSGLNGYGTFQVTYSSYALFDDGWAVEGTSVALPDFNVEASRTHDPKRWFKWRKTDERRFELLKTNKAGEETWRKIPGSYQTVEPYPAGTRLNGRYSYTASYGPLFDGGTVVNKSYVFNDDGTYSTNSSSMSSSADIMDSTVNRVSTTGPDGCKSATAISGGLVGSQSKTDPACGDGKAGTYEIDEWVLTLHANNGITARFTIFPTSEDSFYLNGQDWGK